eukprot:5998694-Pleurochrysis_carterae.AAC.1
MTLTSRRRRSTRTFVYAFVHARARSRTHAHARAATRTHARPRTWGSTCAYFSKVRVLEHASSDESFLMRRQACMGHKDARAGSCEQNSFVKPHASQYPRIHALSKARFIARARANLGYKDE